MNKGKFFNTGLQRKNTKNSQESGLKVINDWDMLTPLLNTVYSELLSQKSLSHNRRLKFVKEIISSLKSMQFLLNEQTLWVLKESEIAKTPQTSPLYKHELF